MLYEKTNIARNVCFLTWLFLSLFINSLNFISIISSVHATEIYVCHGHVCILTYLSKSPLVRKIISVFLKISKNIALHPRFLAIFSFSCMFCTFSFGHCAVCSSSLYAFWLPLWYLQTLLKYSNFLIILLKGFEI